MIGSDFQPTRQVRKHMVLFGAAFNNIYIWRDNDKQIRVPLSFANKERFYAKLNSELNGQDPQDMNKASIEQILPRLSFNIVGMTYRPEYKVPTQNYKFLNNQQGETVAQFTPTPWSIDFQLSSYVRYEAEQLKIFEQIVPFFQPHITMVMESVTDDPVISNQNIHLQLESVTPEEDLFGSMNERRALIYNYNFVMKPVFIYPPSLSGIDQIQKITLEFGNLPDAEVDPNSITEVETDIIGN